MNEILALKIAHLLVGGQGRKDVKALGLTL
jgi:hypothetical protein